MPREVPDSEDEDDFDFALPAPRSTKAVPRVENLKLGRNEVDTSAIEVDPVMSIDFDAICTSTQHIPSSNSDNGFHTSNVVDSSTERFLKEVAPSSSSSSRKEAGAISAEMSGKAHKKEAKDQAGKKRSRTEIDAHQSASTKDKTSARKKAKTTGSDSNSNGAKHAMRYGIMVDGSNDAIQTTAHGFDHSTESVAVNPADLVSIEARTQYTSLPNTELQLASMEGHATGDTGDTIALSSTSRSYTPHTPSTSFTAGLQGGTTSKSSMGNYQGYTYNSNDVSGYDFNPFGSASQASNVEHDADHKAISEVFSRSSSHNMLPPQARISTSHAPANGFSGDILLKMQTSPVDPSAPLRTSEKLASTEEDPPQASPSYSPITNPENENLDLEARIPAQLLEEPSLPQHDDSVLKEAEEVKSLPKKRGRPKKQADDMAGGVHSNIEEHHFEEQHIPRGFRAGTVDSVSNVSEISHVSTTSKKGKKRKNKKAEAQMALPEEPPQKLSSDNLGLDRKEIIGLSPERYKPRPSRRRGRGQSEDPVAEVAKFIALEQEDDHSGTIEPSAKGKKGKKGKGKKGKVDAETEKESKAQTEVVEIEDDVIEMKADAALADREAAEETHQPEQEEKEAADDEVIVPKGRSAKITIDVPQLAKPEEHEELPRPIPEPKKRGRKRKKQVEEVVKVQEDEEPAQEERPALAIKDGNVQNQKAKNSQLSPESSAMIENKDVQPIEEEEEKLELEAASSPTKKIEAVSTPVKAEIPSTPTNWLTASKAFSSTPGFTARARIGLSRRKPIPSLLRKVDRNKEAPKVIEKKVKLNKAQLAEQEAERIAREEAEAEGREYLPPDQMRDKNGMLIEWDF